MDSISFLVVPGDEPTPCLVRDDVGEAKRPFQSGVAGFPSLINGLRAF